MHLADFHTKHFVYELTRRFASDRVEKLAGAAAVAQVDWNLHQVGTALFRFSVAAR